MSRAGIPFALAAAILWGIAYTIDQRILYSVSAIGLFLFDAVLTAVVVLPLVLRDRVAAASVIHAGPGTLLWAIVALAVSLVASFCILAGIKESGASVASVIEIAYPIFVVLFSAIAFREFPNATVLLGGLVTLVGVSLVVVGAR